MARCKFYVNSLSTTDYWDQRSLHIGFSRRDKGLIAIGVPLDDGESWIHINVDDLLLVIGEADRIWKESK